MSKKEASSTQYPNLFEPIRVGPMLVPNRIAETTNSIAASKGPLPDEHFIAHHARKARGGTGWIGSETFLLNSPLPKLAPPEFGPGYAAVPMASYQFPKFVESVNKFVEAVHDAGSVVVCQLTFLNATLAASAVPTTEIYDDIPAAMTEEQIAQTIDSYASASEKFLEAGVDGIEVHCAHETTPQTFLSPAMNMRTDAWGGDAKKRTKYLREILAAIKERIGDQMALGIRATGTETRENGYDLLEFREMMMYVQETGALDFIDADVGHCWGTSSYVQPSYFGHAIYREVGKALKVDFENQLPILFSGRVNDAGIAEQLLKEGCADLVGMTRAGIADPDFANKAREGRLSEIRRCIGCNRCIAGAVGDRRPPPFRAPTCSVNPEVGNELLYTMRYKPAAERKRVVVVGGGPAGLEAARVAADRGHEVTLLDRGERPGGQIMLAAQVPGRDSFEDFVIFQESQIERLGIDLRTKCNATIDDIIALEPEAVICATGSVPRIPENPGVNSSHVFTIHDVLAKRVSLDQLGERVAVVSQENGFETPNIADYIAERGKAVDVFHSWLSICGDVDRYSIGSVMGRLVDNKVTLRPNLRLAAIEDHKLEFTSAFGERPCSFEGYDSVVLSYGTVPDSALYHALAADGRVSSLYLVGSAWVPRLMAEATAHGAKAAMEI
ncbi:MAG: FAD-dependent oxidoreductase [Myxococcales bacterium]|nr:MAG: FAD-dependent oxidoreductase [Myxococcales bacterium]